jgi:hypothetical protein
MQRMVVEKEISNNKSGILQLDPMMSHPLIEILNMKDPKKYKHLQR